MNNILAFFKSKYFFIHLGIILVLIASVILGISAWLSHYTNHNEFVVVPGFKGQEIKNLNTFIEDKSLNYQIIDSIYDPKEKPGVVLRQDPDSGSKVKHNRTVYLYVTGMVAPQVSMPKLIDRSERQARLVLSSYGLKLGKIKEQKADCNGCVLAQLIKGKEVEPGTGVKKGSVIDLVVGFKDSFYGNQADTSLSPIPEEEPNFE